MADLQMMQDFVKQKMAQGASAQEIAEAFKAHGEDPAMIEQAVRIDPNAPMTPPGAPPAEYYQGTVSSPERARETMDIGNAKLYPSETEGLRGTNLRTMVGEGARYALPAAVAFALPEAMLMQLPLLSRMGLSIGANALGTGMGDVAAGMIEGESKETILKKASLDMLMSAAMNTAGTLWRVGTQGAMSGGKKTGIELMASAAQRVRPGDVRQDDEGHRKRHRQPQVRGDDAGDARAEARGARRACASHD